MHAQQYALAPARRRRDVGRPKSDATHAYVYVNRLLLYVSVVIYSGAIGTVVPGGGSILMILSGFYVVTMIVIDPRSCALARRCWHLYVMCGLALVSALWSPSPEITIRQSVQLLFALLTGVFIVAKLGPVGTIKFLIRAMGLICILSAIWAIAFPAIGVHQATENYQSVHAGLWRGVLAHKVTLGAFAGLTLGLLLFYGWRSYATPYSYLIAVISAAACLLGTSSATGMATALATVGILFLSYHVVRAPPEPRRKLARILAGIIVFLFVFMYSGAMNQMAGYLGKSSDLSGRADYWEAVLTVVNSGSYLVGYGYAAGFPALSPVLEAISGIRLLEAHNGIYELLVAFGYPGLIVCVYLHILIFRNTIQTLRFSNPANALTAVFPFAMLIIYFLVSYAESVMLNSVGIWTILLGVVAAASLPPPAPARLRNRKPGSINDRRTRACQSPARGVHRLEN